MISHAHAPSSTTRSASKPAAPAAATASIAPFGPLSGDVKIGSPADPLETEADRMAERVLSGLNAERLRSAPATLQRKCAGCGGQEDENGIGMSDQQVMRKEAGVASAGPGLGAQIAATSGGGAPLPGSVRSGMEKGFGADFSAVRIHTDRPSAEMNHGLNAHAFTYGADIFFGPGRYEPDCERGQRLLAHELTHVVQQSGGAMVQRSSISSAPISIQMASVSSWDFRNSGSTDSANCCSLCPHDLGVGVGASGAQNGMELEATLSNHQPSDSYDIKRTAVAQEYLRTSGSWSKTSFSHSGPDDSHNDDECLTPSGSPARIYVLDAPGYRILPTPGASDTDMVLKASFTEFVEITNSGATTTNANSFDWHAVIWLTKVGSNWALSTAQSEVEAGSVSIGATP